MGAIGCSKANARRKGNAKRKARRVRCETNTLNRKLLKYENQLLNMKEGSIPPPPPRGSHPAWIEQIKKSVAETKAMHAENIPSGMRLRYNLKKSCLG